jgi:hypothetical protein
MTALYRQYRVEWKNDGLLASFRVKIWEKYGKKDEKGSTMETWDALLSDKPM